MSQKNEENVCEFCGQIHLDGKECDCLQSKIHRERQAAYEDAVDEVESLVPQWNDGVLNSVKASIYEIVFGLLKSSTFEDDEGIKIKMTAANKGFIKIDKTKTSKSSVTI